MFILIIVILLISVISVNITGGSNTKNFLVLRHSERLDSIDNSPKIKPWYDTPITSNMNYFDKFYGHFKKIITDFKYIYCSPFTRCIQTAILINNKLKKKIPICIEPGLIELTSLGFYIDNKYFLAENIFERFGKSHFNTNYIPAFNSNKIRKYINSEYTYEVVKKKFKNVLKKLNSGILVAHRELVSVTDSINDDFCGASLIEFNNNNIKLLDSF